MMVTALFASSLLPVMNSLFNPLICAFRIRYFRIAFIQVLSRKSISQAEENEKKYLDPDRLESKVMSLQVKEIGH